MTKTATQLAIEGEQKNKHRYYALQRMLIHLKDWVRISYRNPDVHLYDEENYRVDWMTDIGDNGPGKVIMQAIAEEPELWAHAIPDSCVIVPRKHLEHFILPSPTLMSPLDVVEFLATEGAALVASKAAGARYLREEKERDEEWR